MLVCVLWTILPSPPCCSGSFRRTNGAWIPVSLVQLLAQFFILNCRHNFAGCLFSQIIKIKHRDFTPALNKLRHATAIILLKFARGLAQNIYSQQLLSIIFWLLQNIAWKLSHLGTNITFSIAKKKLDSGNITKLNMTCTQFPVLISNLICILFVVDLWIR